MALIDIIPSLTNHWKLNEYSPGTAAVQRLDSVGGCHMSDLGSVFMPSNDMAIVNGRCIYVGTNKRLETPNHSSFNFGNVGFTMFAWVMLTSLTQGVFILSKYDTNEFQYRIDYNNGSQRFRCSFSGNGTSETVLIANSGTAPTINVWHLVVAWYDPAAQTINIQIDNSTIYSAAYTAGIRQGISPLRIGVRKATEYSGNGYVDNVGICSAVLTPTQRTTLWNDGTGREDDLIYKRRSGASDFVQIDSSSGIGVNLHTPANGDEIDIFKYGSDEQYNDAFLRIMGVPIAKNAVINSANLRIRTGASGGYPALPPLTCLGAAEDNAAAIVQSDFEAPKTTAKVAFFGTGNAWTYINIDVKTIIQELVNRAGWVSGNAMKFRIGWTKDTIAGDGWGGDEYIVAHLTNHWDDPLLTISVSPEVTFTFIPRIIII